MDTWSIFLIVIVLIALIVGGVLISKYMFPAVVSFHKDSLAPIRGLVGNPDAMKTAAAVLV